jgi:hypothetical protein
VRTKTTARGERGTQQHTASPKKKEKTRTPFFVCEEKTVTKQANNSLASSIFEKTNQTNSLLFSPPCCFFFFLLLLLRVSVKMERGKKKSDSKAPTNSSNPSSRPGSSRSDRGDVDRVINEIRTLRSRLSEMSPIVPPTMSSTGIGSQINNNKAASFSKSSSPTSDDPTSEVSDSESVADLNISSLSRQLEQSRQITKNLKKKFRDSTNELKYSIQEREDEQKRRNQIDQGYHEVVDDLRRLVTEKEEEILQLKSQVPFLSSLLSSFFFFFSFVLVTSSCTPSLQYFIPSLFF